MEPRAATQFITESIWLPVMLLALWTWLVLMLTGFKRIGAVVAGRIKAGAFKMGDGAEVPVDIAVLNRNLMNLLEMPVLFYVVCVAFYVTNQTSSGVVGLAWAFLGLRMAHSVIHIFFRRIVPRVITFLISNLVLLALWLWFGARMFLR